MLVSTPLIGRTKSMLPVAPSVTWKRLEGLKVSEGIVVVKHGFTIMTLKPIVEPPDANELEPAGPLLATVMSLARVSA